MKQIPTDRHITYSRTYRHCGKPSCHCHRDQPHGPYIYAFWQDDSGKLTGTYVGKAEQETATKAEEARP